MIKPYGSNFGFWAESPTAAKDATQEEKTIPATNLFMEQLLEEGEGKSIGK
jgi:hypothetical protein